MARERIDTDNFLKHIFQIKRGEVPGYTYRRRHAFTPEASTVYYATVWVFNPPTTYRFLSSAQVLQVSSSSVNDTGAGVGARTVFVDGLDANYNFASETVTLNGQTAVNTVNSYLRVNHISVFEFGALMHNDGSIYVGSGIVSGGVNDNPQAIIRAKLVYSETGVITVPLGYTMIMYGNDYVIGTGKQASVRVVTRNTADAPFREASRVDLLGDRVDLDSLNTGLDNTTLFFPEKADVIIQAIAETGKTAVSVDSNIILVDNKYY